MSVSPQVQVRAPVSTAADEMRVATPRRPAAPAGFERFIGVSILAGTLAVYAAVVYGVYLLYSAIA